MLPQGYTSFEVDEPWEGQYNKTRQYMMRGQAITHSDFNFTNKTQTDLPFQIFNKLKDDVKSKY